MEDNWKPISGGHTYNELHENVKTENVVTTNNDTVYEYRKKAADAQEHSIKAPVVNAKKQTRKIDTSAKQTPTAHRNKTISRVLAFIMVFAIGAAAEQAEIPDRIITSVERIFDNDEMYNLADQFNKKFDVKKHATEDHMHYFFDSSYREGVTDLNVVTPNTIAAVKVATGSDEEAKLVLMESVSKGTFKGDPEETKEMLNDQLKWNRQRHKLTLDFKEAGEDLDTLIQNEYAKYASINQSVEGKGVKR